MGSRSLGASKQNLDCQKSPLECLETGTEKSYRKVILVLYKSTSNPYTTTMNNTINTSPVTFTPSFTPNIGMALTIDWGAAGVTELISDTRWTDSGEYEIKLHTYLGNNYGLSEFHWFTAGRWYDIKEISERYAETRDAFRKQYKDPKWYGIKYYDMSKVKFAKPL